MTAHLPHHLGDGRHATPIRHPGATTTRIMPGCDGPPGIPQGRHPAAGHPPAPATDSSHVHVAPPFRNADSVRVNGRVGGPCSAYRTSSSGGKGVLLPV